MLRDLKAADNQLAVRDLYRGMRAAGDVIRDEVRRHAVARGLVDSGALVRSVRTTQASSRGVVIAATAAREGYPYPARYEYGASRSRAFAGPGLDDAAPEAVQVLEDRISRTLMEHNL